MPDSTIQFLPFHAINEFMRPDFRLNVIRYCLNSLSQLPNKFQEPVNRHVRKVVKVPGFRNSEKAPTAVKILPTSKAFEKDPELVAAILAAWSESKSNLRLQVFDVLKQRGWQVFPAETISLTNLPEIQSEKDWNILPPEADRSKLPGFLTYWPKDQDFEAIYNTYTELYPQGEASLDEVSLMAVWLADRLPYHISGEEEPEKTVDS
jgi:hypothetical protein